MADGVVSLSVNWGKEVDYNLFPVAESLDLAHENNTDANSLYGNSMFVSP